VVEIESKEVRVKDKVIASATVYNRSKTNRRLTLLVSSPAGKGDGLKEARSRNADDAIPTSGTDSCIVHMKNHYPLGNIDPGTHQQVKLAFIPLVDGFQELEFGLRDDENSSSVVFEKMTKMRIFVAA